MVLCPPFPSLPGAVSEQAVGGSDLWECLRLAPLDSSKIVCLLLLGRSPGLPPGLSATWHGPLPADRATPLGEWWAPFREDRSQRHGPWGSRKPRLKP